LDEDLTLEERAANHATWRHIHRVQQLLLGAARQLMDRALAHDQTKLVRPEVTGFANAALPTLAGLTYGDPGYEAAKRTILGPALAHHYARNRHHPEFHKRGIEDMNLLDLVEMLLDWKAASERHNDGNIRKSIEINAQRFGIDYQLRRILENTVETIDRYDHYED
jgi:hypothetical protein